MRTRTKQEEADPRQVLADLEERVRDGDTTVSASALAKAKQAAEHADLLDEANERARQREAAAKREAEIDTLRKDITKAGDSGELAKLRDTYSDLTSTLRSFDEQVAAWTKTRTTLIARAKRLGLEDEAETLPDLMHRDWLKIALEESRGHYEPNLMARGRHQIDPPRHHALRSPSERERIDAEWKVKDEAAQARKAEDRERARLRREARRAPTRVPSPTGAKPAKDRYELR